MSEACPTFFADGNRIVEVATTHWRRRVDHDGYTTTECWELVGGVTLTLPTYATRVIYELPIGCYEQQVLLSPHSPVTIAPGGDGPPTRRCRSHASFEVAVEKWAEVPV